MLRNLLFPSNRAIMLSVLNEVLSLNAQEFFRKILGRAYRGFLNEVLSLNAQE